MVVLPSRPCDVHECLDFPVEWKKKRETIEEMGKIHVPGLNIPKINFTHFPFAGNQPLVISRCREGWNKWPSFVPIKRIQTLLKKQHLPQALCKFQSWRTQLFGFSRPAIEHPNNDVGILKNRAHYCHNNEELSVSSGLLVWPRNHVKFLWRTLILSK